MKKLLVIASVILLMVVSFRPSQAGEWDWVKSANVVNISNINYGMLILPMNDGDEFLFYIAPFDYVGQDTTAICGISYYEDPFNYLVKGTLSTFYSNYISWRSSEHHLVLFTCMYSSGVYGNIHMVAGDNSILGFPTDVTPPTENIMGKYSLDSYKVVFSDGTVITDEDITMSGTLMIGDETISEEVAAGNVSMTLSGTYTVTYTNGTSEGYFTIEDDSGTHVLNFWISGYRLTTYSGVVYLQNGVTVEEWDTWKKVSDSILNVAAQSAEEQISVQESNLQWIGNILYNKNLIYNK